jgi:hypothetical protein
LLVLKTENVYHCGMAKSPHSFNKRQREKDKQKRNKEKREKREERKIEKAESGEESTGPEIDWESAPVNKTMSKEDENERIDGE